MMERVLNTSVKQTIGVSPDTLLFGNVISMEPSLQTQLDRDVSDVQPRSIRDDNRTSGKFIDVDVQSKTSLNASNLRKRYDTYSLTEKLRQRVEMKIDDHTGATDPISISHIVAIK